MQAGGSFLPASLKTENARILAKEDTRVTDRIRQTVKRLGTYVYKNATR